MKALFKNLKHWPWFLAAIFLFAGFLSLSSAVGEAIADKLEWIQRIDTGVLEKFISIRGPVLSTIAVDLTALGSTTLLTLFVIVNLVFLLFHKNKLLAAILATSSIGAAIISFAVKAHFERSRPDQLYRLVDVQGYSYPSGHALSCAAIYLTICAVLARLPKDRKPKIAIAAFGICLVLSIAITRMYLGVHYFSDVVGGLCLGSAWAALLQWILLNIQARKLRNET